MTGPGARPARAGRDGLRSDGARNDGIRNDDGAAVALLLSVIGLLGCLPVAAVGLAMGYSAQKRIAAADGTIGGGRTARAAVVVGWVGVGISVAALVAVPVLMAITGRG